MQTRVELGFNNDKLGFSAGRINEDTKGICKIAENTVTELWYERQEPAGSF